MDSIKTPSVFQIGGLKQDCRYRDRTIVYSRYPYTYIQGNHST